MRTSLAAALAAVFIAAAAPDSALTGRDRLSGRADDGELVVVDEAYRVQDGRIRLVRRSATSRLRTCLEVEADAADAANVTVAYRREGGGDERTPGDVSIDVRDGRMAVQVGSAVEETQVAGDPVPTSLIRFLAPGATHGRRLLIEPYGLVAAGHVMSYVDPAGGADGARVHMWEAAGLTERVRSLSGGALLDVAAPAADLVLTRDDLPPDDHPLKGCGAPKVAAAAGAERFDDLTAADTPASQAAWEDLKKVRTPWDLGPWVAGRVEYEEQDAVPTADEVVEAGRADCVGMAILGAAAARALGWRARQVLGVVDGPTGWSWHQWAEVRWGGRWVQVDPAAPLADRRTVGHFSATPRAVLAGEVALLTGWAPGPAVL